MLFFSEEIAINSEEMVINGEEIGITSEDIRIVGEEMVINGEIILCRAKRLKSMTGNENAERFDRHEV